MTTPLDFPRPCSGVFMKIEIKKKSIRSDYGHCNAILTMVLAVFGLKFKVFFNQILK